MPTFMILPSREPDNIRLLRTPADYEGQELFRHVTGLVAEIESHTPEYTWDDIAEHLESQGYEVMKYLLGPSLD